jgi:dihydrofolate reductase
MRSVILYLTMSADGHIADADGGVGWLVGMPAEDYGYHAFYASVDDVLLGAATYEQILGFGGDFPYPDKPVYVFTSRTDPPSAGENVVFVDEPLDTWLARHKYDGDGRSWLGGGAKVAMAAWNAGLVDELDIFVQPMVLGSGIALFDAEHARRGLDLIEARTWPGGIVELRYKPRA